MDGLPPIIEGEFFPEIPLPDEGMTWGLAVPDGDTLHTVFVRLLPKKLRVEGRSIFEAQVDAFKGKSMQWFSLPPE